MDNKVVAKNLGGVVVSSKYLDRLCKMVIADNPYLDKESAEILCRHIDDLRLTIGVQDDTIAALKNHKESILDENVSLRIRLSHWEKV
jgi:hypothetical protein